MHHRGTTLPRPARALALLSVSACLPAGCGPEARSGDDRRDEPSASARAAADPRISLRASDGQKNVSVRSGGRVVVEHGTIAEASLTTVDGRPVPGRLARGERVWSPETALEHGTTYRLTAVATDGRGARATRRITFTTLPEADRFVGTCTPEDKSTVGAGMPVSFTFDKAITDRKAVESGIEVSSSSRQEVVGHWFGARRLDFRPRQYWEAGSEVTVRIRLDGVRGAEGAYGEQDRTVRFTVDAATHRMTVVRDGRTERTIPLTAGAPSSPTWNGRMVISEKPPTTRMNGATVGFAGEYDIPDVTHAMRLSTSGTFIHGNYWGDDSVFGRSDISHGCVGLNDVQGGGDRTQDAAWFFDSSLLGDVVEVRNPQDGTIAPDNGLNGWNMPWHDWKAGSAR